MEPSAKRARAGEPINRGGGPELVQSLCVSCAQGDVDRFTTTPPLHCTAKEKKKRESEGVSIA